MLATRHMEERDAVTVLRAALRDPADEVRLLAYALLDRREKRLSAAIRRLAAELEAGLPQPAAHHQRLAELHWEMAYLGLATGEVLRHYLREARRHARRALAAAPAGGPEAGVNRAELHFLLARVALWLEDHDEAQAALVAAAAEGLPRNRLLPYLAELAFVTRRYALVPRILAGLERDVYRPGLLTELEAQWLPEGLPEAAPETAGEGRG